MIQNSLYFLITPLKTHPELFLGSVRNTQGKHKEEKSPQADKDSSVISLCDRIQLIPYNITPQFTSMSFGLPGI